MRVAGLALAVFVCLAIAAVGCGYVTAVKVSGDHRDRLRARCERHAVDGVARVRVSVRVATYARRQGWPRVLRVGGFPLRGDVVAYDGGREAERVLRATWRFCRGQDYLLVVAR